MKFTLKREAFTAGLQQVQNVVSTRTPLPILSNILLKAEAGGIRLTATDLDVSVQCFVEAEVTEEGGTTLPARRLFSIARELPSSDVSIDVTDKNVATIKCGQYVSKIVGLPHEEFPPLPKLETAKIYVVPQIVLKDALKKTSYAISTDETRFVLNGLLFAFRDGKLTIVATDGRRLALVDHPMDLTPEQELNVIIPAKAINELGRLASDEGDVTLKISNNQASFELNNAVLVTKLIDGNYPNYKQVIPGDAKERVSLERDTFFHSVRRVALLTSEKSNSLKLVFTKNNLDMQANSPEIGEAKETLAIKYGGKDMTIAFNPEYLQAPLRNLADDEIFLDLIDEMSPGVLRTKGSFLYVLMPMRINY